MGHPNLSWSAMPHAKAATALKREASNAKELALWHVLTAYQEALMSDEVMSVCEADHPFNVPRTTLQECINGWGTILSTNSENSWLDDVESEVIVNELIHSAQQGFPDMKRYLCGQVNAVIQEKLGDLSFHVGENWVNHWLEKWGKWLSTYWSTSLDVVCAMALNP